MQASDVAVDETLDVPSDLICRQSEDQWRGKAHRM